jgi:hypothetical protein
VPFVIDVAHLERQREFSLKTFGPGHRRHGVIKHIEKELDEIRATDGTDVSEWADVVILALDGALRAGHDPQTMLDAILAKQELNESRQWPDPTGYPEGEAIEHIRDPYTQWDEHHHAHDTGRPHLHVGSEVRYTDLLLDYPPDVR